MTCKKLCLNNLLEKIYDSFYLLLHLLNNRWRERMEYFLHVMSLQTYFN